MVLHLYFALQWTPVNNISLSHAHISGSEVKLMNQ